MAAGNFDGDTKRRSRIVDPSVATPRVRLNGDGDGNFAAERRPSRAPTARARAGWSSGKLNGDAVDDVVIYNDDRRRHDDALVQRRAAASPSTTLAYDTASMTGTLYFVDQSAVAGRHQRRRPPRHPRRVGNEPDRHRREVPQQRHGGGAGVPGHAGRHQSPATPGRAGLRRLQLRRHCSTSRCRPSAAIAGQRAAQLPGRRAATTEPVDPARPRHRLRRGARPPASRSAATTSPSPTSTATAIPTSPSASHGSTVTVLMNTP